MSSDYVDMGSSLAVSTNGNLYHLIGKPVAVICNRFSYRGILAKVNDASIVLDKAMAVENAQDLHHDSAYIHVEDNIGCPVMIYKRHIELLFQPKWCFSPLPD